MSNEVIGTDLGTMNCVSARKIGSTEGKDNIEFKFMRNMYLEAPAEALSIQELTDTNLDYAIIKDDDGEVEKYLILGEDSFKFSQIFGQDVKRPMSKGVISTKEIDSIDVLTLMMEKIVGTSDGSGYVVYSVPAQAVDVDVPPVLYHEKVFSRVFNALGFKSKPLNEAMAIIYGECQSTNFTGIAISWGAGLTNVSVSYKGTPAMTFSVSRGGDWIDKNVAESTGVSVSRVTAIKERDLDLTGMNLSKNKKERRIQEALIYYYTNIIEYVLKVIDFQFHERADGLEIDEKLPIVISGGTSKAGGFLDIFKSVFSKIKDFPYDVSEIRSAKDPLTAVAYGNLVHANWETKSIQTPEQPVAVEESGAKKKKADKENENQKNNN